MTTTCRLMAGQKWNLFERANALALSSEDADFGKAFLFDGRPSLVYRAASAVADLTWTLDGDLLDGKGGYESWPGGAPDGWTEQHTAPGDVSQEGTIIKSGASSLKLTPGASGVAQVYREITDARSGEWAGVKASIRGDGTGVVRLRVLNPKTGNYLQTDGTWAAGVTDLATQTAASWQDYALNFQVESFGACLGDLTTLRVIVLCNTSNQVGYADDVELFPAVDVLSVHGHNLDPAIAVQLRSSTDNFGSVDTLEATATKAAPTFYALLGARVFRRYWRVKFVGTNSAAIEVGEAAMGHTFTLGRIYKDGPELRETESDSTSETDTGELFVRPNTRAARRVFAMSFRDVTDAGFDERRDEFFRRSRGRALPFVIIPDTDRPEVLHARMGAAFSTRRRLKKLYDESDIVATEQPFAPNAA